MDAMYRSIRSCGIGKMVCLLLVIVFFVAACGSAKTSEPATDKGSTSPLITESISPEPTITVTPEPTVIPTPEGLGYVPDGYSPLYNSETRSWGYAEGSGADAFPIPYLTVDSAGAHFALDGASFDIATADIGDRIMVGQEGALQIYNEAKTGIDYAWDTENNVWVVAAEVIHNDLDTPEGFISIQSIEDLMELARLERMVLPPFPENTYFPPLENIIVDYCDSQYHDLSQEYSSQNPLGSLPEGATEPFGFVNYIVLEKDPAAGRNYDSYIVTQQVFNPSDGTFSLFHFGGWTDIPERPSGWGLESFVETMREWGAPAAERRANWFILPRYMFEDISSSIFEQDPHFSLSYYNIGDNIQDGSDVVWPEVKTFVVQWLSTGHVPEGMEDIIFIGALSVWKP